MNTSSGPPSPCEAPTRMNKMLTPTNPLRCCWLQQAAQSLHMRQCQSRKTAATGSPPSHSTTISAEQFNPAQNQNTA